MLGLLVVGFVAGVIVGISPCILPVLPVVLTAGATSPSYTGEVTVRGQTEVATDRDQTAGATSPGQAAPTGWRRHGRPVAVVLGLVISFSLLTLAGTAVLGALHLPQDLLMDLGLALLALIGVGLLVPAVGHLMERPFARVHGPQPSGSLSGLVLGLALGAVFVPCAGPVLATISVLGATHRIGLTVVLLTGAFALGVAVPLLVVALAGEQIVGRARTLRSNATVLRSVAGVVVLATVIALAAGVTDPLQRALPGYTTTLQKSVEGTAFARSELGGLSGSSAGDLDKCTDGAPVLERCGAAPAFTGITRWLNTPGDRPLTLSGLRGQVVLVDFWTYSCINCQRTLPHVEAWYRRYHADGFTVVGVHTPEFAFEHVVSNVQQAARQLGVHYPVAIDDRDATWDAYHNEYWPAEYLVDAQGVVRHVDFAEGNYAQSEHFIRTLLHDARPGERLPPPTSVPNRTPREPTTPESYLGYQRIENLIGSAAVPGRVASYSFPSALPLNGLGVSGQLEFGPQSITAVRDARIELHYQAKDVYLVLGGRGTVAVSAPGLPSRTITVHGIPRLYTMVSGATSTQRVLTLTLSPGVQAYDFTFG